MLSKKELQRAIAECEGSKESYQNCQKLATLYILYDHLYKDPEPYRESIQETVIDMNGDSDFLKAVSGKRSDQVWVLIDELMETLKIIQPKLYDSVLRKLTD